MSLGELIFWIMIICFILVAGGVIGKVFWDASATIRSLFGESNRLDIRGK
jgi:hypothetical protein